MLLEEDLAGWLRDQGITAPISYDALPDGAPHLAIAISFTGGLGLTIEKNFDRPTFSILSRGPSGRAARDLGLDVDRALMGAGGSGGFFIGTAWCIDLGRFGGPPAFVAMDDLNRAVRSAIYWAEIEY